MTGFTSSRVCLRLGQKAALIAVGLILAMLVAEIGYRVVRYQRLRAGRVYSYVLDGPLYDFDIALGFRHRPHASLTLRQYDPTRHLVKVNHLRVNNAGQISPRDVVREKPPGRYRIAVLGDSFTASIFNDVPWPTLLEDRLNRDQAMRTRLRTERFEVLNFGMVSTGVEQFADVFLREAKSFAPDLVIINLIDDDLQRRFVWKRTLELPDGAGAFVIVCTSLPAALDNRDCMVSSTISVRRTEEAEKVIREVVGLHIRRLSWLGPRPEALMRILLAAGIDLGSGLNPQLGRYGEEEGARASAAAVRRIAAAGPRILVLNNPRTERGQFAPQLRVVKHFAMLAGVDVVEMAKRFPASLDPTTLFEITADGHFSPGGAEAYADSVHRLLRDRL